MIATRPQFVFPPRPEYKIKPASLSMYDNGEYFGQPKLNGSACVLMLNGNDMVLYNRHGELLTNADTRLIDVFNLHRGEGWMILCGELLNKNKYGEDGQPFNQRFCIWDIIMFEGLSLEGTSTIQRIELLDQILPSLEMVVNGRGELEQYNHLHCIAGAENCYKVVNYERNFVQLYDELVKTDVYEGLVLKQKAAKLQPGLRESNNGSWQVKARKQTKNYNF